MKENIIKTKSFDFALLIMKHYKILVSERREFVMSKQLLRSGTAVGALIREAEHAESKADFIHKLAISLKEANESEYWIDLLYHSEYLTKEEYDILRGEMKQILSMLISIIKSSKSNHIVSKNKQTGSWKRKSIIQS